jgi:hypothetical protein
LTGLDARQFRKRIQHFVELQSGRTPKVKIGIDRSSENGHSDRGRAYLFCLEEPTLNAPFRYRRRLKRTNAKEYSRKKRQND